MDVREKSSNEKRLIDADELLERISIMSDLKMNGVTIAVAVAKCATIDAVPVVRCRECKHHRDKNEQEHQYLVEDILICTSQDATEDCWNAVWPDHFCSYGERKEGADNG